MSYGACDDVTSETQRTAYEVAMKSAQIGSTAVLCPACNKRYLLGERCECHPVTASDACFGVGSPPTSILTEAASLISGERRNAYGTVNESFARVARTWTDILKAPVTPQQVALCMIALKLHREAHASKRDNRVDIAGYAALLDQLYEK